MRTPEEIVGEMDAIVASRDDEADAALTDEQVATYEALEAELSAVNRTGDIARRHQAYKTPITGFPAVIAPPKKGDEALEFAFDQYLRTGIPNAEITGLRTGETFAQEVGTPSAGGYAVPDGFRQKLTERRKAYGGLMNAAEQLTTTDGRPLEWPTVDDTADDDADIVAEGAASAAGDDIEFGTKSLGAYRYAATGTGNSPIKVSVELLQDAMFDVGAFVARALGNRIRRKQAKDLLRGSGSGEPLGLMFGNAGTIESDIVDAEDLNNLVHALDPDYRESASWIFNDTTAALIENIVDINGRPILVNSTQGIEGSIRRQTLLGYPVIIDQAAYNMDSTDDQIGIAFGDLREAYIVRHVRDVQVLVNPYAATGYVVYDAWARMDGTIQNPWAVVTGEGV